MAERTANDLSYGHFGELYYDSQTQQWLSKRHQSTGDGLQALGRPRTYVQPEILQEDVPTNSKHYRRQLANHASNVLASTVPDFGVAQTTLKNHTLDWTESAAERSEQDWKRGDLLALAKLHSENSPGHRTKECTVLAFPSGGAGDIMKLTELRNARHGWGVDRKSAWLKTFEVKEADSSTYYADGRIRQICFAKNQVDESHPLLAVRTAMSITVFLPQLFLSAESAEEANHGHARSGSRIALQQVNKFSIKGSGLVEFVDMSFNPWFPTLLAAVLEDGRYHLWTLLPGQHTWDQKDSKEGDIGDLDPEDIVTDKWHRIVWMSNSTFIVATRTHLKAFRRRGENMICINQDVLATNGENIILDVRRSPIDDSCIFVTNTTHIMCLHGNRNIRNVDADLSFAISLSWRHYRDPDDVSLKLSFIEEEAGLKIVLLSRATALTMVYDLTSTTHEHPLQLTTFDSYHTNIVSTDVANKQGHTSDLLILPSELRGRLTLPGADLDEDSWLARCMSLGYGFYQALKLHGDLSIDGQLAYAQLARLENEMAKSASPELFIPAPIWNMVRSRYKLTDKTRVLADDTFLDDDDAATSNSKRQTRFRRMKRQGARHTLADLEENPDLVISLKLAYNSMIEGDGDPDDSIEDLINSTRALFTSRTPNLVLDSLATFCSATRPPLNFDNSMNLAIMFRQALHNLRDNTETELSIVPLGPSRVFGTGFAPEQVSLFADWERILHTLFVQPLRNQLATAAVVEQAHLLKSIAWRTSLAGFGVCRVQEANPVINSQSSEHMPSQRSSQTTSASQVLTQTSPIEPEEEEDGAAAVSTAQRTQAISLAISRLSLLTSVHLPTTSQSKNEALILDHWSQGGNPTEYDYEEKTAALAGTINLQGSAMTAEVSQQVKRKKKKQQARDVKRRKIEEKVAESSYRSSQSMARPHPSSQQPVGNRRLRSQAASQAEPMSSQAFESQLTTASQPVSGAYGGRLSIGRRSLGALGGRRRRRAGF